MRNLNDGTFLVIMTPKNTTTLEKNKTKQNSKQTVNAQICKLAIQMFTFLFSALRRH